MFPKVKNFIILILIVLVSGCTFYRMVSEGQPIGPQLNYEIINIPSTELQKSKIAVNFWMDYDKLIFIKEDNLFKSRYTLSMYVFSNQRTVAYEKNYEREIIVKSYWDTQSKSLRDSILTYLDVEPGEKRFVIVFTDLNSNEISRREQVVNVKNFGKEKLIISDIILSASKENPIVNSIGRMYSGKGFIYAHFYVVSDSDENIVIKYLLTNKEKNFFKSDIIKKRIKTKISEEFIDIFTENIPNGNYKLEIFAQLDDETSFVSSDYEDSRSCFFWTDISFNKRNNLLFSEKYFEIKRKFDISIMTEVDLDIAIAKLTYLTSFDEIQEIKKGTFEEKKVKFLEFWKTLHPNLVQAELDELIKEYYSRADLSDRSFSTSSMPGWMTDRGRILMIYGQPDEVQIKPAGFNTPAYEIWFYKKLNRHFVFSDQFGFGDYKLVSEY
jgi:GWxTD domain-containing protein